MDEVNLNGIVKWCGRWRPIWSSLITKWCFQCQEWVPSNRGVVGQKYPLGTCKQPRLLPRLLIALLKLMWQLYCWKLHLYNSVNTSKWSQSLPRALTPVCYCSWYSKALCGMSKEKSKHQPATKSSICNNDQPARCSSVTVAQSCWV